uniref:Cullin domain-containing protein n=1 Tax=Globodera pallida TaxID=36090 RepID=A0A183CMK0_GLOPA
RHIVERCGICSRTVTGILQLIEKDRRGIQINKQLLKSLIRIFMNLQMYDRAFEREFLKATEQFYREESQQKIQELDLSLYLHHVQKRIAEEEERVHLYLEYGTFSKLIAIVERCFISAYLDTIIAKGVDQLLSEHRLADLALLFRLLSRVREGLPALKIAFADYIKKMGKTMVMDTDRDKTLVSDLMTFKSGLDTVITDCFSSNEKFLHTLKDSFDFFINTRANKIAELIAKFMDSKLRTGNKECSEEELDSVMDRPFTRRTWPNGCCWAEVRRWMQKRRCYPN